MQIDIKGIAGIQNIESRISFIESRIKQLDGSSQDENADFKSILFENIQNNAEVYADYNNLNAVNTLSKINTGTGYENTAGNNYIADYVLENLFGNIKQLNDIDALKQQEGIYIAKENSGINESPDISGTANSKLISGIKDFNLFEGITAMTEKLGQQFGVDPDLVNAIIKIESNFNPMALSHAGAMGLMQLMPATAQGLGVTDPYDISQNLNGGIRMIKQLLESFNGDIKLALAAYNAGPGRVAEYGGIPPIEETQNFINKVLSIYKPEIL